MPEEIKTMKEMLETHERALFGDEKLGELGLIRMNKEMYDILIASKNVTGMFGKVGAIGKWVFVIVGILGILKGWWIGLLTFLIK